jgi:hypothetical protein
VERKMYDSCLTTTKVDGDFDTNISFGAPVPPLAGGTVEEYQDNYAWVSKLGICYTFSFSPISALG